MPSSNKDAERRPLLGSRVDFLTKFHNKHLEELMSHRINIAIWKTCKPDEVVGERRVAMPGEGGRPTVAAVRVTAKQALENEERSKKAVLELLQVIENMLEAEGVELDKGVKALAK